MLPIAMLQYAVLRLQNSMIAWAACPCVRFSHQSTLAASVADPLDTAKPYLSVPGPKPIPFLGNTWRFIPFIGDYRIEQIDRVCQKLHDVHGNIVKLSGLLGRPDMVFLFDPAEVEKVFRAEELMPHRPSMPSLDYYKHNLRKDFFGDHPGIIAVHGEKWYEFRTKVQQAMLQPRVAKLYVGPINEAANEFINRVRTLRDENSEMPADFLNEIHKWSLESIARVALDTRLGCLQASTLQSDSQELIDAVTTFFTNVPVLELKVPFWRLFSTPTWNKYINALDTITRISMKYISAAVSKLEDCGGAHCTDESSLLERILAQDPSNPKIACILALDMILVGIDTTSTAVASILYQLSQHPEKQTLLHDEVARVLPGNTPITTQLLEQMPYLRAVIKETLRMYPVVIGNGRCMTKDTVICGYRIPKGTQVVFQHLVMSNSEKYFRNAAMFQPERWLKSSTEEIHPFASLPFGYGRRMCLGRRFADLEIQIVIAKMVQSFKIEFHHKKLSYCIHPMYTPNGPLRLQLKDHND